MASEQTMMGCVARLGRSSWRQIALLPLTALLLTACGDGNNTLSSSAVDGDLSTIVAASHARISTRPVALVFRIVNTAGVKCADLPQDSTLTWDPPVSGKFVLFDDFKDGKELCYLSFKDGAPETVHITVKNADGTDFPGSGFVELDLRDTYNTSSDGGTNTAPKANTAPTASSVTISDSNGGSAVVEDVLNGSYVYNDVDNDLQGVSTFRWLRNGVAIAEATSQSYKLVAADAGTSITFQVTPVAVTGSMTGTPVTSSGMSAIALSPLTVTITGKVTFDLVPTKPDEGLDYGNTVISNVRKATVEALGASNTVIATTKTGTDGTYSVTVPANTNVKIRVKAELTDYNLTVVDNTNAQALYVLDGSLTSSGAANSTRDLYAPSGWNGSNYTSDTARKAAPFAILNSMYIACEKIRDVDPAAPFSPLKVNWSVNNAPSAGDKAQGQIETSHYYQSNLYILGKQNVDTDEFDDHVMLHEWGHYFEDKFSRSDSMGEAHGDGDILDMRISFGEAWGNALSGMITDNPVYLDTANVGQKEISLNMNLETETAVEPGFYSEGSLGRVLYDLYDSTSEVSTDAASLGFTAIYHTMVGKQKNARAYTSIFTFIQALKENNSTQTSNIDSVVSMENMTQINDIYGDTQTDNRSGNPNILPIYTPLTVGGGAVERCSVIDVSPAPNKGNRLSMRRYFRFTIAAAGDYTLTAQRTSGRDPAAIVFNVATSSPFNQNFIQADADTGNTQTATKTLAAGDYVMEVYDNDNINGGGSGANVCFNVSVINASVSP